MEFRFRISQSHLNLLETCPPKFQKVYLEKLVFPHSPEQKQKTEWGTLFHLLMQQINLGFPLDSLLIEDQELKNSVQALVTETSDIWQSKNTISYDAEHYLNLNYQGYLLTVIFDLLVFSEEKAVIFDWKTYLQPENSKKLANNWQTKLYLYVLAETSSYKPEDISMTYWFVKLPHKPISLTFNYNSEKHQQTKKDLDTLLNRLSQYLEDYINKNNPFPHINNCPQKCPYYNQFFSLDERHLNNTNIESLISIENIEPISIK